MARFSGEYSETFTVDVPIEQAKAHFSDLETIVRNYGGLRQWKKLKNSTLKLVLEPRAVMGVVFEGEHSCRWQFTAENELEWKSVSKQNMWTHGSAHFTPLGKKKTRITFTELVEYEIEANFIRARLMGRGATRQIRDDVKAYLKRMRDTLE